MHPAEALTAAIDRAGAPVCVGLDPVAEQLPAEVTARHHEPLAAVGEFCRGVLESVAGVVAAVKFQSACFERFGGRGVGLLEEKIALARRLGLVVVLDAKRGDIGTTCEHYAEGFRRAGAAWVTVNGYLGRSGIVPFLQGGLGVFVLVRTSNPDSDAVQAARLADGRSVSEMMADEVAALGREWRGPGGLSAVGAVVGATKAGEGAALRARMPEQVFLVPGYGAQGGTAEDVRAMARAKGAGAKSVGASGVLVTASRSVIYAKARDGERWTDAVRAAAAKLASEVKAVVC